MLQTLSKFVVTSSRHFKDLLVYTIALLEMLGPTPFK